MSKKRVDKGVPGMELLVCRNPKAAKRYEIEETIEFGMVLPHVNGECRTIPPAGQTEHMFYRFHSQEAAFPFPFFFTVGGFCI